ncbi:MAG: two-component regulator propeller domain-containing protein, partial [Duganella sp.]
MRNRPLLTALAPLAGALIAALTCSPLRADDRWHALAPAVFEHLVSGERNFPSPTVMSVVQDGDGFMWFGTQAGLG